MTSPIDRPTLPDTGIFSGLKQDDLDLLASYGSFQCIQPDHDMIRQGEDQQHLYFVIQGKLGVRRQGINDDVVIGVIQAGESIGEMSIFDPAPASASVRAMETSYVWKIDAPALRDFNRDNPGASNRILVNLATVLSRRLRTLGAALVDAKQA
jgi:CRP/FNR family transcriptional regulator, cyclic AMP receptor protein